MTTPNLNPVAPDAGEDLDAAGPPRKCFYPSLCALPEPQFKIFELFRDHYTLTWRRFPHPELDRRIEELAFTDFRRDRIRCAILALEHRHTERARESFGEPAPPPYSPIVEGMLLGEAHLRDHVDHQQLQRLYALERSFTRTLRSLERDLAAFITLLEQSLLPASEPAPEPETAKLQNEPNSTPRNAPCPCGSGRKTKRCCGKHLPPVLGPKPRPRDYPCS